MSKYTPGPWKLGPMDNMGMAPIFTAQWKNFAKVRLRTLDDDEPCEAGLANAALILAAPDMAEALQDLSHPERRTDCNERKCGECSTCRARAALKKAGVL